jgi:transcriptional regulator of acetoin/glycerol metabolism
MSEDTGSVEAEQTTEVEAETEKSVPYERFDKVNKQARDAKAQIAGLTKQMDALKAQMEERESAGMPELDRLKKDMERAQKRAEEAEAKAAEADTKLARSSKERWVVSAAKDFADPLDAVAFVNLDDIEDEKDAERAVKRLASQKKHLLKADEPNLPGRVLQNGHGAPAAAATGGINPSAEAQQLANTLKNFLANRQRI